MSPSSTIFGRPCALGLGRVADRLHVALVQVLQPGEHRAVRAAVEVALDLDDRRRRRRAPGRRTPGRRCACAGGIRCSTKRAEVMMPSQPSFWTPGSPARNLSVTSLPRPALRKRAPGDRPAARCAPGRRAGLPYQTRSKVATVGVVDLAEVVVEARDLEPLGVGRHHPPRHEVVERRAPEHRLLAAGVHRDVAADARGVGRRRVDGEHEARGLGGVHHAAGHHAGAGSDRRHRLRTPGERDALDRRDAVELLGVDHRRARRRAESRRRCSRCRRRAG